MPVDRDAPSAPLRSDAPSAPPPHHDPTQLLRSEDAASGEELGTVVISDEPAVREAVRRARSAAHAWAQAPLASRVAQVRQASERLLAESDEVLRLLQRESGMTRTEALALELLPAVHRAQWAAGEAAAALGEERGHPHLHPHRDLIVRRRARGVVAVCAPWNAPLAMPLAAVFDALLAGNGVVLKPSRSTPLALRAAREVLVRRGIPRDLVTIVHGGAPVGEALVSAGVDRVVFAGSEESGKRLALQCAARLIPATLELASTAPGIVCRDAPLGRTVPAVVAARFAYAGQRRASLQRLFVHASRYDEVCAALTDAIRSLRPGDPTWTTTDVGPVKRARNGDRLEEQLADALRHGATIATGGGRLGNGRIFEPTLVLGCTPEMRLLREVVTGPVLSVMRVEDEHAAAAFASHPPPGPIAYVFTDDEDRAEDLAARVPAGCVAVNDALVAESLPDAPFGADAPRGIGRSGGLESLRDMARAQVLAVSPFNVPERALHWPPYSSTREAAVARLARAMHGRFAVLGAIADLW
jgi:acyl-CoA reductase-like NAD-dependent aldehyde dehydrogenase